MKGNIFMKRNLNLLRTIGNELRNIREVKDISMKEVAEQAGVSQMYISEIERNKKSPSDELVKKLSDIYKIEEFDLFEGFERIPEVINEEILSNNGLFELLYKIANNPNIGSEEKENFYKQMNSVYDKMF